MGKSEINETSPLKAPEAAQKKKFVLITKNQCRKPLSCSISLFISVFVKGEGKVLRNWNVDEKLSVRAASLLSAQNPCLEPVYNFASLTQFSSAFSSEIRRRSVDECKCSEDEKSPCSSLEKAEPLDGAKEKKNLWVVVRLVMCYMFTFAHQRAVQSSVCVHFLCAAADVDDVSGGEEKRWQKTLRQRLVTSSNKLP